VVITVQGIPHVGCGYTFTIGRGTEVVCAAIQSLSPLLVGKSLLDIYTDFGSFWHSLTCETQLRWIGPEKGVIHLAVAAVINALWDLWGKIEGKPVWQLLSDMSPEEIISLIDWQYLSDALTKEEALQILRKWYPSRNERIKDLAANGYPAYITSAGWLSYSDDLAKEKLKEAIENGFSRFKMKVGHNLELDKHRCQLFRDALGWDVPLMMDANQCWDVDEAISHMTSLAEYKPLWIEEPTSPDDILGHAKIGKALRPLGIGIATGEHCHNRVMFKQFLEAGAMDYCQIDSCRLGGVNENIAVMLLAEKFQVPVCPHAGGCGLCELSQHLSCFYYICVNGIKGKQMLEYADHLHEHFVHPVKIQNGAYILPRDPGYSSEMKSTSISQHKFPDGVMWHGPK
jgi:L-fuconate dehydratase